MRVIFKNEVALFNVDTVYVRCIVMSPTQCDVCCVVVRSSNIYSIIRAISSSSASTTLPRTIHSITSTHHGLSQGTTHRLSVT